MTAGAAGFPAIDGVDTVRGLGSVGASPLIYRRLLRLFCEQHADDVPRLARLLRAGERGAAARQIHRLRGSALILGMVGISHQALEVERLLGEGADAEAAAGIDALGVALTRVVAAIRRVVPDAAD